MDSPTLRTALKRMVIAECGVKGVTPTQLSDKEPIIGGGILNLDSLDAVEIVAALERSVGIRMENVGDSRVAFKNFDAMADYVLLHGSDERVSLFVEKVQA